MVVGTGIMVAHRLSCTINRFRHVACIHITEQFRFEHTATNYLLSENKFVLCCDVVVNENDDDDEGYVM